MTEFIPWYVRNQEHTFDQLLRDLNIDEALIQNELQQLLSPVIQQMVSQGHLRERARKYLEQFYYHEDTLKILKDLNKKAALKRLFYILDVLRILHSG